MNERYDYMDLETIVRNARMERSIALGSALAGLVARLSATIGRAIAGVRPRSSGNGTGNDTASVHR